MKIKNLIDEDFVNYKKPSMFIGMPHCSFKCDKDCGKSVCQNSELAIAPNIEIESNEIVKRYYQNPITEAIVFGGLEPFDSYGDMVQLMSLFACGALAYHKPMPDIVIYTGYNLEEIKEKLLLFKIYIDFNANIIIKFGRFIPDKPHRFDELLGVELSSNNQYAVRLENIIDLIN